jgi:hypothetical protein
MMIYQKKKTTKMLPTGMNRDLKHIQNKIYFFLQKTNKAVRVWRVEIKFVSNTLSSSNTKLNI